ncbi:unnamed protein product, partial [Phaeothamnion confervicola]
TQFVRVFDLTVDAATPTHTFFLPGTNEAVSPFIRDAVIVRLPGHASVAALAYPGDDNDDSGGLGGGGNDVGMGGPGESPAASAEAGTAAAETAAVAAAAAAQVAAVVVLTNRGRLYTRPICARFGAGGGGGEITHELVVPGTVAPGRPSGGAVGEGSGYATAAAAAAATAGGSALVPQRAECSGPVSIYYAEKMGALLYSREGGPVVALRLVPHAAAGVDVAGSFQLLSRGGVTAGVLSTLQCPPPYTRWLELDDRDSEIL